MSSALLLIVYWTRATQLLSARLHCLARNKKLVLDLELLGNTDFRASEIANGIDLGCRADPHDLVRWETKRALV